MVAMGATVMDDIDPDALVALKRIARALMRGFGEPEPDSLTESDLVLGARLNEEVITVQGADPRQHALALAFEELRPRREVSLKTISMAVDQAVPPDADQSTRKAAFLAAFSALAESGRRTISVRRGGRPEEARSRTEAWLCTFGWSFAEIAAFTDPGHSERVRRRVRRYLARCGRPAAIILEEEVKGRTPP